MNILKNNAAFTVFPTKAASASNVVPISVKAPSSNLWLLKKADWSRSCLISFAANSSGEINSSTPISLKLTSSLDKINSILEILAIVLLKPNCFAKAQSVIFKDSWEVTPIKRSELLTSAFFKSDKERALPLIVFISNDFQHI